MPSLSDRFESRRQKESGEAPASASPESLATYNDLYARFSERASRLSAYRSRSDRGRMIGQLREIDDLVHAMLGHLGEKPR